MLGSLDEERSHSQGLKRCKDEKNADGRHGGGIDTRARPAPPNYEVAAALRQGAEAPLAHGDATVIAAFPSSLAPPEKFGTPSHTSWNNAPRIGGRILDQGRMTPFACSERPVVCADLEASAHRDP